MKRKLTPREWMLLGVLAALVVASGYVLLFYMPVTSARDTALAETESCKQQTQAAQARLEDKYRMEQELEEIFAKDENPLGLADYDNRQSVMRELNTTLADTLNYSLSFATVDASKTVVRRDISISFSCNSYGTAKAVLQRLHDSIYRCMLNNLSISLGRGADGQVSVSGNIVYFECHT